MSEETKDTGKGAYGTRHVMEEQMRAAEQGVFEEKSSASPEDKMLEPPENKAPAKPRSKAAS